MALRHGEITVGLGNRVRLTVHERELLAATEQDTTHDTLQDKSLIHKEKGEVTQHDAPQDTLHDTIHVTEHVEHLITTLTG